MTLETTTEIFSLLKNPDRARVLVCLNGGEACVKTLADDTALKQPALSHHLQLLRQAGLVTVRTNGKFHLFSVETKKAAPFLRLLTGQPILPDSGAMPAELIYTWDVQTNEQRWYGDVDRAFGYERGTFPRTVEAWEKHIHPEDRPRVLETAERHMRDGKRFSERYRIVRLDGTEACWQDCGSVMLDASNRPYKWVGMTRVVASSVDGGDED